MKELYNVFSYFILHFAATSSANRWRLTWEENSCLSRKDITSQTLGLCRPRLWDLAPPSGRKYKLQQLNLPQHFPFSSRINIISRFDCPSQATVGTIKQQSDPISRRCMSRIWKDKSNISKMTLNPIKWTFRCCLINRNAHCLSLKCYSLSQVASLNHQGSVSFKAWSSVFGARLWKNKFKCTLEMKRTHSDMLDWVRKAWLWHTMNLLSDSRNEKSKSRLHVTTLNLYRLLHKVPSPPHLKANSKLND